MNKCNDHFNNVIVNATALTASIINTWKLVRTFDNNQGK